MESFRLDPEQQAIYEIMESTRDNIFLTGKAGSGKSVLLRYFVEHTGKNKIVLAPTGIAAINVGGQTIHSFFAFDYTVLEPEKVWINDETAQILQKTDTCIIDEISMVRSDVMECVNRKFQIARNNELPFGGVQMIVFGDLYQLPPVVAEDDVRRYLDKRFGGSFFFNAPVIKDAALKIYELERIYRQEDSAFQDMLNEVRIGAVSPETIDRFNARHDSTPAKANVLTIATINKIVDEVNDFNFRTLPGKEYSYEATINGDVTQLQNQLDTYLRLKVGAQVMMLRNRWADDKTLLWANGTLGEIAELSENEIKVKIDGVVHNVKRAKWQTLKHSYNEKTGAITKGVIGEFIQFPLCLAWAFTIHKSQGQTYKSVSVNFGKGAFLHGQAYVALSRCRFLNTLSLIQSLKASDVIVDRSVADFIAKHRASIPGTAQFNSATKPTAPQKQSGISVLISCSKLKRTYPCEARLLYDKSDLFIKSLAYAQTISDDIQVISAKHGLVRLDEVITPYDETLANKTAKDLAAWGKLTATQIFEQYDLQNTEFVILAGQNYYKPLMTYLPRIKLPLIGLPIGERMAMLDKLIMCGRLHRLFNSMPRYHWNTIDDIGFDDGIYIVFEKGEAYYDMDRVVRVGTHTSNGRLRERLKDHFIKESKDGSIFRKNIGRAILNKNKHPYLSVWNIDTSVQEAIASLGDKYNLAFQQKVEKVVTDYMRENFSFACFPVATKQERLRLEEGIIAVLNASSDFAASPNWRGKYSPEYDIAQSGLWLLKGLYGIPPSESEYMVIERYCSVNPFSKNPANSSEAASIIKVNNVGVRTADVVQYISGKIADATATGVRSVTIVSGDIHKELGLVSRMPTVCGAMRKLMKDGDVVHYSPPSGNGSRLKVEYFLHTNRGDTMPFIDWNGNGKIDPADIAISVAMGDEYDIDASLPKGKRKSGSGCLTSVMTLMGIVGLIILLTALI